MTIPDLGHCAGSGAAPIHGSADTDDPVTGVCAACSGRFELRSDGTLSLHEAAGVDTREDVSSSEERRSD